MIHKHFISHHQKHRHILFFFLLVNLSKVLIWHLFVHDGMSAKWEIILFYGWYEIWASTRANSIHRIWIDVKSTHTHAHAHNYLCIHFVSHAGKVYAGRQVKMVHQHIPSATNIAETIRPEDFMTKPFSSYIHRSSWKQRANMRLKFNRSPTSTMQTHQQQ